MGFNVNLKRRYYQFRYWQNIYKTIKKHVDIEKNLKAPPSLKYIDKPGVAFSFDDSFRVEHWSKYGNDIFGYYDVKVTFNINAFHHFENERELTQNEIDMLIELQANGHEIAHHGYKHKKATEYASKYGSIRWIKDEIVSLFDWMETKKHSITNDRFKTAVSFAFPHFVYNDQNISDLISDYYKIVRGHLLNDNLTPHNFTGFAPSICLDTYYSCNLYYLKKIMRVAKEKGQNLILTCHSILPDKLDWKEFGWIEERAWKSGDWRISPKCIKAIIEEAKKIGLEFYTTSEIAGVATFIDYNFEKCIREKVSTPSDKWILISEVMKIEELDLSNRGIKNLDGIQYFLNLKKINLTNNSIRDYRILERLPQFKELVIINNGIEEKIV